MFNFPPANPPKLTAEVFLLVGAVMEPRPPPLTGERDSSFPRIFRVRPPSQEVSDVSRGSGVLLLSRNTSMLSTSTPLRSQTPEIASLRQVPLTAGTKSSHSEPQISKTAVKNSVPDTFPAEESFRLLLLVVLGTSRVSLSVSLELSISSFSSPSPMASRLVKLLDRPWKRTVKATPHDISKQ